MIELRGFSKSYKTKAAVRDVSLSATTGSITGLLGPNGSGKTTILKAAAGVHLATGGRVLVEGCDAAADPRRARSLAGYAPESPGFKGDFTVREMLFLTAPIALEGRGRESGKNAVRDAVEGAVETLGLRDVLSARTVHLSKGYVQRLSLALALLGDPPALILDEPASGLDPAQIYDLRELLRKLSAHKTVLLSTHLIQEAESLCSTLHVLRDGGLAASGTREELCAATGEPTLEQAYLALCGGPRE
ncbi:MAG: ABC transporter ATP-binding protein [Spirochaetaceae bacterium]|jgi:ABC-2 type transport system ATP-binding protein|nr:ABC transporter ATP-binding protein [Spirochaetaceae bacterium]